ncbi:MULTISPECIES: DUF3768 domain-containing protein [Rhodobacterales]|uniref:DUF3768 domain-containing protein n=1 Tax=Pelagivirga sediminicola TaxID=2170575 RepID=A0A2T7G3P0_9RHOB|nr:MULTISPECIES: DUF3768 domain-containing protein [Rhodobacterales]MCQ0090367.1 DUF3768 domain-containing protein [Roseovarius sp. M141]PVA09034.1 hypothetical protein DC366_15860 [Pelagivirga sediminicola]
MNHEPQSDAPHAEDDVTNPATAAIIAKQNDAFRTSITGSVKLAGVPPGKLVMTAGIAARSDEFRTALIEALVAFDAFDANSDPYGLHEMGVLVVEAERVWFKFDLYDENFEYGAETPTDPARTRRVLTLLFPSEY